jgi:DNA ligase 1
MERRTKQIAENVKTLGNLTKACERVAMGDGKRESNFSVRKFTLVSMIPQNRRRLRTISLHTYTSESFPMIKKPMLAGKAPADLAQLKFPGLCTPKLDGIRCLVIDGKAVSRTFKPIPNDHIRTTIESEFAGYRGEFDGEILVRNRTFNELSGDIRRSDGKPDFYFAVFDMVSPTDSLNVVDQSMISERGLPGGLSQPYSERMAALKTISLPDFCKKILPVEVKDLAELQAFEEKCIAEGYEGAMWRSAASPYKQGRSSTNEGYLLKIKRFEDAEALIIAVEEMMHNDNVATKDAFGRTERSTHKENMRPAGVMGKLVCELPSKVTFEIGTGFTAEERARYWKKRGNLIGKQVKFKHQPSGADEKPRFPVFLGFRDDWDRLIIS